MEASTVTVNSIVGELSARAEEIRHTDPVDLSSMEIGDEWRQGDVGLIRLRDDFLQIHGSMLTDMDQPQAQLAPGTSVGSRHCLDSLAGVTMYRLAHANALDGPILRTTEARSLLHPEHGDLVNFPPGIYGVQFDREFAAEIRRLQD